MPAKGRQTPTQSVILPYEKTKGREAVRLYNQSGRKSQKWQSELIAAIMGRNKDGLWTHVKFGYSVPRRNGKTEILMMRELWGLMNGEHILHTAHRTTTSHSTWEKLCDLLSKSGLREKVDYKTVKQFGLERIEMLNGDGRISFRTRSSKGGLGEGYDLLIIDEAQEYTLDQETALKYVVTDSKNPQTIFCGTPPTAVSAGTVFLKYREDTLASKTVDSGWAEWSVESEVDVHDRKLWYETNPSLGTIFSERAVLAEITQDTLDFNIQRLGLWIKYNLKSAISEGEWNELREELLPELRGKLGVGIKYGKDGRHVALSVAVRTADDRILVETIDCRDIRAGNDWILGFLDGADAEKVLVDGKAQSEILAQSMKEMKLKEPTLVTVPEVIEANAAFEKAVIQKKVCHMGQPSLTQSATNTDKRPIGQNGGFGYRSLRDDVDVVLLDSAILAYWVCLNTKTKKKKRQIRY